ncbi:MAG: thioesterase family protein [Acidobacteriia bacterium]|nr:thioesterase family protein [Terriglobia bacterium]
MSHPFQIPVGTTATRSITVTRDLTVAHFHSGMPEVYGTPFMIYLMETASAEAIQPFLPPGWASVGTRVEINHLAATPVGFTVTAKSTVVSVDNEGVTFAVTAHDGLEKIGEGTHRRAPVDLGRFEKRMQMKRDTKRS